MTAGVCLASPSSAESTASGTTGPLPPSTSSPRGGAGSPGRWFSSRTWWTCQRGTPWTTPSCSPTPSSASTSRSSPR
ncbi:hypothetical protein MUK42_17145 [Musa troglodytarum]|uniref:Uncharacterized protein n=1 Tax=Musa troglodytarum TaxID=320322 RepID=A0A9E7HMT6_9LILI|nr:hypothetical protein MUK42_17145 [Musa troglodytarum]